MYGYSVRTLVKNLKICAMSRPSHSWENQPQDHAYQVIMT